MEKISRRFSRLLSRLLQQIRGGGVTAAGRVCRGEINYIGQQTLKADLDNLRAAMQGKRVAEGFMPSISPRGVGRNEYYANDGDYYTAVAQAMRVEYFGLVEAGFILQVNDPWLIEILSDPTQEVKARRADAARQGFNSFRGRAARSDVGRDYGEGAGRHYHGTGLSINKSSVEI